MINTEIIDTYYKEDIIAFEVIHMKKSYCSFGVDMKRIKTRVNNAVITVCNHPCKKNCRYFVKA
jgi:hypothetical protein